MKTVVLTGGTGFIGANILRRLVQDGQKVHLFLQSQSPRWRIEKVIENLTLHEILREDKEALRKNLDNIKPDWIFHLAAFGGSSWQVDKKEIVETNLLGTINLLDACLEVGFEAFVYAGSSSEYGFKNHPPQETEFLEPNSCYAISKAGATHYCQLMGATKKAHIVTLRLYSVFGSFEQPKRLMPAIILQGLKGRFPPLVDPEIARDFIYIDDVVDAFIEAAKAQGLKPGEIFNIGTARQTKMKELVAIVKKQFGITTSPQWNAMPSRNWDTGCWVANHQKAAEILKWTPKISLEDGLKKMTQWFLDNPHLKHIYEDLSG